MGDNNNLPGLDEGFHLAYINEGLTKDGIFKKLSVHITAPQDPTLKMTHSNQLAELMIDADFVNGLKGHSENFRYFYESYTQGGMETIKNIMGLLRCCGQTAKKVMYTFHKEEGISYDTIKQDHPEKDDEEIAHIRFEERRFDTFQKKFYDKLQEKKLDKIYKHLLGNFHKYFALEECRKDIIFAIFYKTKDLPLTDMDKIYAN